MYCLCLSLHYLVFELFKCVLKLILRRCILFCLIPSWQERQVESCLALCPVTSRLDNLWNFAYVRTFMFIGISVLSIINNHTISVSLHAWWLAACPHLLALTAFISPHLYCILLSLPSRRLVNTHSHSVSYKYTFPYGPALWNFAYVRTSTIMTSVFLKSWLRPCIHQQGICLGE